VGQERNAEILKTKKRRKKRRKTNRVTPCQRGNYAAISFG
jgi:hypothetical protein